MSNAIKTFSFQYHGNLNVKVLCKNKEFWYSLIQSKFEEVCKFKSALSAPILRSGIKKA